jgi:triosephosphate isomerase
LWAIGSGHNLPAHEAQAVIEQLRAVLEHELTPAVARRVRTIYGGSVAPSSIEEYMHEPDIDGVLVGKAALEAKTFLPIIEAVADRAQHRVQHPDH